MDSCKKGSPEPPVVERGGSYRFLDLSGVDLRRRDLSGCDFTGAVLEHADFVGSILRDCDFTDAILRDALLAKTDLSGAMFQDAVLTGTCLDPAATPKRPPLGLFWAVGSSELRGYATRVQPWASSEPVVGANLGTKGHLFSVDPCTEYHPGLFVYETPQKALEDTAGVDGVYEVTFNVNEIHEVNNTYRVRYFYVLQYQPAELVPR